MNKTLFSFLTVTAFLFFSVLSIKMSLPSGVLAAPNCPNAVHLGDFNGQQCWNKVRVDQFTCSLNSSNQCDKQLWNSSYCSSCSFGGNTCNNNDGGVCSSSSSCNRNSTTSNITSRANCTRCVDGNTADCRFCFDSGDCSLSNPYSCVTSYSCSCSPSFPTCWEGAASTPTPTPTPTPPGSSPTPPPPGSPPPVGSNVDGYHDVNSGTVSAGLCYAAGWAADPDDSTPDVNIRIFSDGVQVASTVANGYRADLQAAGVCTGGTCSWLAGLYGLISNGVDHQITAQAQDLQTGGWRNLNLTPRTINCCGSLSGAPTVTAPVSPIACNTASTNVTWSAVSGATSYALRIDDLSNGWTGTCAAVNPGDVCIDNQAGTTYNKALVAGRSYNVWVHARNSCGEWSAASPVYNFTAMGSLTLTGSQNIQAGSSTPFTANLNPSSATIGRVDFTSSNGTVASVSPASDNNSSGGYTTTVTGLTGGTSNIGATAYSTSGAALCTVSPQVPVTVSLVTVPWWQVRGGDVTVNGNLSSSIPATCVGACTPIFNLKSATPPTGSVNHFNGTADFSAAAGAGTGAQPTDLKASAVTQLSQVYDYNYFAGLIPSGAIVNDTTATTLSIATINAYAPDPTTGYIWVRKTNTGNLTLDGTLTISTKVIIFVSDGDLLLGNSFADRVMVNDGVGFLMAIVNGDIIVSSTINSVDINDIKYEGLFFARDQFHTGAGTGRLVLRGSFVAMGGFNLQRDLADDTVTPAEYFEFSPELLTLYPSSLTNKRIQWQEVVP